MREISKSKKKRKFSIRGRDGKYTFPNQNQIIFSSYREARDLQLGHGYGLIVIFLVAALDPFGKGVGALEILQEQDALWFRSSR